MSPGPNIGSANAQGNETRVELLLALPPGESALRPVRASEYYGFLLRIVRLKTALGSRKIGRQMS